MFGCQVCHADTLVAAYILDDENTMAQFARRCQAGHDQKFKPTFEPNNSSSVVALVAETGPEREQLACASFVVLVQALGNSSPVT